MDFYIKAEKKLPSGKTLETTISRGSRSILDDFKKYMLKDSKKYMDMKSNNKEIEYFINYYSKEDIYLEDIYSTQELKSTIDAWQEDGFKIFLLIQ